MQYPLYYAYITLVIAILGAFPCVYAVIQPHEQYPHLLAGKFTHFRALLYVMLILACIIPIGFLLYTSNNLQHQLDAAICKKKELAENCRKIDSVAKLLTTQINNVDDSLSILQRKLQHTIVEGIDFDDKISDEVRIGFVYLSDIFIRTDSIIREVDSIETHIAQSDYFTDEEKDFTCRSTNLIKRNAIISEQSIWRVAQCLRSLHEQAQQDATKQKARLSFDKTATVYNNMERRILNKNK